MLYFIIGNLFGGLIGCTIMCCLFLNKEMEGCLNGNKNRKSDSSKKYKAR